MTAPTTTSADTATRSVRALRTPGGLSVRVDPRAALVTVLVGAAAVAVGVVLIGSGDYPLSFGQVVDTLLGNGTAAQEFVVRDLRLPRALVAVLVGASLALSGAIFQSLSRNPLGSPDVIGFSHGASVGALSVIVLSGGSALTVSLGAVAGGLATGALVYTLAWRRGVHGLRLVLVGIGVAAMLSAVIHFLVTKANLVDATRATLWMTGSLDGRDWAQVGPLALVLAVLVPVTLVHGRPLRMLEMGDDAAYALGVPLERTRIVLIGCGVLFIAVATGAAGPIAFVALSAPQLARRLTRAPGPNLAAAAVMGAALLLAADWIATEAFPGRQLPVGVVTGVLGGCYLLWLLVTERRAGRL
ncbi:iron chelate uptake ABC transporter family permease subunit [Streptomyces sp. C10-9-1]|uniref:FecCD family ABC transporter permease n=1 Tax=Streptomyces sp. C10-9-1 TaxID=1859285 RepID=UPI002111BCF0|nr:iron chelate uptake ABC transporter family permease subunit [Streptomyces sp. C10-9-1]MCQ6554062.1 iron chelate uptake ABC transporter family permease subunit [Streptomyces sp. C10-9-1]